MNNEQVTAARTVLNKYDTLKVTIGKDGLAETLTPYSKDDVFRRGPPVYVMEATPAEEVSKTFDAACRTLLASADD